MNTRKKKVLWLSLLTLLLIAVTAGTITWAVGLWDDESVKGTGMVHVESCLPPPPPPPPPCYDWTVPSVLNFGNTGNNPVCAGQPYSVTLPMKIKNTGDAGVITEVQLISATGLPTMWNLTLSNNTGLSIVPGGEVFINVALDSGGQPLLVNVLLDFDFVLRAIGS